MYNQGLIYSENAVKLYRFIELAGPSPEAALQRVCKRNTQKYLKQLIAGQYIKSRTIKAATWYCLPGTGTWDLNKQEVRAWFCARWLEIGGEIQDYNVISPAGVTFELQAKQGSAAILSDKYKYKMLLSDLKSDLSFNDCLKPF